MAKMDVDSPPKQTKPKRKANKGDSEDEDDEEGSDVEVS